MNLMSLYHAPDAGMADDEDDVPTQTYSRSALEPVLTPLQPLPDGFDLSADSLAE